MSENDEGELFRFSGGEGLVKGGFKIDTQLSKPVFGLRPDELAEPGIAKMVAALLALARTQEEGLLADSDTEFVHQYRVNIRKARSLVSLFKKIFSTERYHLLDGELKVLGRRTNDLRDLDVFLLDFVGYRQLLPENQQSGLKQLADRLKRRRRSAFNRVYKEMQDPDYLHRITLIEDTLKQEPEYADKRSAAPLKELVAKKICNQYLGIVADGSVIDDTTADQAVHDLRIECKKLRYLLELFIELFKAAQIKELIKKLKLLQDNLGRFNDFSGQREFLGQLGRSPLLGSEELATINGLQAVLFEHQRRERGHVVESIRRFSNSQVLAALSGTLGQKI